MGEKKRVHLHRDVRVHCSSITSVDGARKHLAISNKPVDVILKVLLATTGVGRNVTFFEHVIRK